MPVAFTSPSRQEPSYPRIHRFQQRGPSYISLLQCYLQSVELQQQQQPSESERRLDGNISNYSFGNLTQLVELQQNRDVEIEKTDQVQLATLTPAIGVAPGPPPLLALRPLDIWPPVTLDPDISNFSGFAVTEMMRDDGLNDISCFPLPPVEPFQSAESLTDMLHSSTSMSFLWDCVLPYALPYQAQFEGQEASSSSSTVGSSQSRRHIPPEQVLQEHSPDDKLKVYQILNTSRNRVEVTSRIQKLRRPHIGLILESASSYCTELSPVDEQNAKSRRRQDASLQCLLCEASLTTEHNLQSESFMNGKF